MDYKVKYEQAIANARAIIKNYKERHLDDIATRSEEDFSAVFPELKESEDERIRNMIINTINRDKILTEDEAYDCVTWLEKQGEKEQDPCEHCNDKLLNCHNFPCIEKREFEQGKSALEAAKEEKVDNANKVEPKDYNDIDPYFGKPADKIEPKFHRGDWVVTDKCDTVQIRAVNNGYYTLYNGMIFKMSYVDKYWHRWTIADAKDGDVLYSLDSCRPFIYKERKPFRQANAYCGINEYGKFFVRNTKDCIIVLDKYVPATKEQRDTLFSKMKEAGYEWDAEKKEPKKIDSKPSFDVEIPFGAKDSELKEVFYSIPNGFHAEIEDDKVVIKQGEQKPTERGEEDEKRIDNLCHFLEEYGNQYYGHLTLQGTISWLKSLRPQNTWKPSDEQMKAIRHICDGNYNVDLDILDSIYRDFKKLREE